MPIPRLVVTGASGFIGRHVLQAVVGKVHALALARPRARRPRAAPRERGLVNWTYPGVSFVTATVAGRNTSSPIT